MTSATSYLVWLQRKWVLVVARDHCCRGCGGQGKRCDAGATDEGGRWQRQRRKMATTSYLVWLQRKWVLVVARDHCCRGCGGQGKSYDAVVHLHCEEGRWQREIAAIKARSVV
ncbi:hypothetical protein B296_00004972 [Ensete ventricosum]|uniref:Uncharacterized protein n=1 Tax=Ensete ventricosum TaxID=4639 RepID=A0A426YUC0_ENSVE|nr:hypothetical protein B296_00004972 [Ensete ventricosum]